MRGYLETFRRHRLLYLLPPLVVALAVGAVSYTAPKSYVSTASLWVDNQAASTSSLNVGPGNVQAVTPSSAEQAVLNELLLTAKFDAAVVAGAKIGAGANSPFVSTMSTSVTSMVPGPQVLTVSYTGSSPVLAHKMVGSLVAQLQNFTQNFAHHFASQAASYNQAQVASAARAVANARTALNAYQRAHPGATTQTDQTYASLVVGLASATSSLNSTTAALNQALAQVKDSQGGSTVTVLDQPSFNAAPLSGLRSVLMKALGAAAAALMLSALVIVVRTPSGVSEWDEVVSDSGQAPHAEAALRAEADGVAPVSLPSEHPSAESTPWPESHGERAAEVAALDVRAPVSTPAAVVRSRRRQRRFAPARKTAAAEDGRA